MVRTDGVENGKDLIGSAHTEAFRTSFSRVQACRSEKKRRSGAQI